MTEIRHEKDLITLGRLREREQALAHMRRLAMMLTKEQRVVVETVANAIERGDHIHYSEERSE